MKKIYGKVIATKEQLMAIGIDDVPTGALVELYNIDRYLSPFGPSSEMHYKYKTFDYIIPTCWVSIVRHDTLEKQSEIVQQRLNYHFKTPGGSWNVGKTLPFMKEFLNEVQLLCDLSKKTTK